MLSELVFCSATVGLIDQLPVHQSDAHRSDRRLERQVRAERGSRSRRHRDHVGIVLAIRGQHHRHDLRLIAPRFREQRAQRAIDQPRRQNFFLRRAPFALEESAGNFSGRIRVFAVIHGQRQKIAVVRRGVHARGGQHDGVAVSRGNRAVGLLGDFPGLQNQRPASHFHCHRVRCWRDFILRHRHIPWAPRSRRAVLFRAENRLRISFEDSR